MLLMLMLPRRLRTRLRYNYGSGKKDSCQAVPGMPGAKAQEGAGAHCTQPGRGDMTGKKSGRGAYICNSKECFEKAVKEHRFERSFKGAIDRAVYDELREQLFS